MIQTRKEEMTNLKRKKAFERRVVTEFTVAVTDWSAPAGGPVQLAGCGVCPGVLHGSTAAAELELVERAARARIYSRERSSSAACCAVAGRPTRAQLWPRALLERCL